MPGPESAIPVGTQFSPELLDLRLFLKALVDHSGDLDALKARIWTPPVHKKRTAIPNSRRNAMLPLEAAVQYELLSPDTYEVTEVARRLLALDGEELYLQFARHIMLNLGGLRVVEACEQMAADGRKITGDTLARYLTEQGFRVTEHNTAINSMRMWLALAGVFAGQTWRVDPVAKEQVLGLAPEAVAEVARFNAEQRAFLNALCQIAPVGWYKAADLRALAEANSGLSLPRGSLPKDFLIPLEQAGLVEYRTSGTKGGKTSELRTTEKFKSEILEPFVRRTIATLDATLTAYYLARPEDFYRDLDSEDKGIKGRALEAYAVHIMRLLGLRFVAWRKRAQVTAWAEVDVLLAGLIGVLPTRWQIQCKNKPSGSVDVEDVAKEVGLVRQTKATHVMLIANSQVTDDARRYAAEVNRTGHPFVFLLDQADFETVKASPGAIGSVLRAKAEQVNRMQQSDPLWGSEN